MSKLSEIRETISRNQRLYYLTGLEGESWIKRKFYGFISFISILISEQDSFKLFNRASSGTYTTMLALVPFIIVGGSLILTFNKEASVPTLIEKINEFVIPIAGDTIANFLNESLTRTLDIGLGPVGLISLLVTTVMLFVHIEDCFNDIWHVTKPRAFYLRILLFYAVVTLGPLLFSFSIFQTTQLIPDDWIIVSAVVWKILREILVVFVICFVVFKFLPNTRVTFRSALIPAVIVAVVLEGLKFAFGVYLNFAFRTDSNYSILYGAIGIIPITLLWLYLSWVILLFGVEMGYCMQNMRILLQRKFYDTPSETGESWIFIGAYAPIEVLGVLVRHLCDGGEPPTTELISRECVYPLRAVEAILKRLEKLNIVRVIEGEFSASYVLARPLDAIRIQEIMEAFDESSPRTRKHEKLHALVEQLISAQEQIWSDSNLNVLREDGVALKDVSDHPTMSLHIDG